MLGGFGESHIMDEGVELCSMGECGESHIVDKRVYLCNTYWKTCGEFGRT